MTVSLQLATSFGVDFFETSNKASINVDDAFQQLTSNVLRGLMEQKVTLDLNFV